MSRQASRIWEMAVGRSMGEGRERGAGCVQTVLRNPSVADGGGGG
jgi:hypothetical protein